MYGSTPRGAWTTWGVEEQLLISSSCLSPGRVKKLRKFKNYSANLKHSKSTWSQLISSYGSYKIRTSKALGTMQAQHFFVTGTFGNDRSIGQFRASRRLITKVSTPGLRIQPFLLAPRRQGRFAMLIQLFRERLSEKMCTRRNYMWYDQCAVPDTVAVESSIVAFYSICKHSSMASRAILSNFFEEHWTQNHLQYLSGLSHALFPTTFLEIAVCNLALWAPLGRGWFLFYGLM